MASNTIVVTNCTARKRAGVHLARLQPPAASTGLGALIARWRESLSTQVNTVPAGHLYVGRSISEARAAADALDAQLFIVSAGLGLVSAERQVPGYDLSASGDGAGLPALLEARGASVTDWWRELNDGHGLLALLGQSPNALILLALPADYLRMLGAELTGLSPADAARLRIFTSASGRKVLAHRPDMPLMPYDDRLEAIPGFAGTRSDFPQRALRHFVSQLEAHRLDADAAHSKVEHALAAYKAPKVPVRRRLSDEEICTLIRNGWAACGGNSARLLRHLRDDQQVACEQGRFAALRRLVAEDSDRLTLLSHAEATYAR